MVIIHKFVSEMPKLIIDFMPYLFLQNTEKIGLHENNILYKATARIIMLPP